jgi:MFS family permease
MTRMDRSSSGPLRPYLVNQTVHWFIVGLISSVLIPLVLDKELNIFEAGTVLAIHSGTDVLLELPTGGLANSIGRREVYLISVTVHTASVILLIVAIGFPVIVWHAVNHPAVRDAVPADPYADRHDRLALGAIYNNEIPAKQRSTLLSFE